MYIKECDGNDIERGAREKDRGENQHGSQIYNKELM